MRLKSKGNFETIKTIIFPEVQTFEVSETSKVYLPRRN